MSGEKVLWINAKLYTPDEVIDNGRMVVSAHGCIEAIGGPDLRSDEGTEVRDIKGKTLLPGFIDIHIHGGNGFNVMQGTYESLDGISKFHAKHGTTSFLATTSTSSKEITVQVLKCASESIEKGLSGADMIGIHLEGPFLNIKRRGAQNKDEIRLPNSEEIENYLAASRNKIKLVTLAPEVQGGIDAVKQFIARGVTVSIGHSDATYEQVVEAIQHGANHTTHHFNGMSPLHHREPGVAGAGLFLPQLTTELIADGIHVHPAAIKHLFESKSPHNVCLVTDAVACAGLPDGDYGHVTMKHGKIVMKEGSSLAGSSLTTIQAIKNAISYTGYSIDKILPSLTQVPARQIGMEDRKGSLQPGKDADFIIVDETFTLYATYVRGKAAYVSDGYRYIIEEEKHF